MRNSLERIFGIGVLLVLGGCSGGGVSKPGDLGTGDLGTPSGIACVVAPITITHSSGYVKQTIVQKKLDLATYPEALCNDGTPALYAIRPGYGSGVNRWLISLEGGGSCYDQPTCAARRAATTKDTGTILTTSSMGVAMTGNNGILASDPTANPDFYDANEVRVHYCSSDSWQGMHTASGAFSGTDPATWNFKGHAIVKAVVQDLLAGPMANATEVVLEGESGGGEGVFMNANLVHQLLPSGVRFVAISDAAFGLDLPGYDPNAPGSVSTAPPPYPNYVVRSAGLALWAATGDIVCAQTHPASDLSCSDPKSLLMTQVYPFPFFVRQSEEDEQKMPSLNAPNPTTAAGMSAAAQAYYTYYEGQQRAAMNAIPAPYSAFGPNITDHITLLGGVQGGPYTYDTPVFMFPGGIMSSTQQAVSAFYATPCMQRLLVQ